MKTTLRLFIILFLSYFITPSCISQPNQIKEDFICPYCDLVGKDFSNQDLTNANLVGANLENANFTNAKLIGTQLIEANLHGANFSNALIDKSEKARADFSGSNLTKTSFSHAKIGKASFQYADISCADFSNTNLDLSIFGPRLNFVPDSDCKPKFQNCNMTCEFPWNWPDLDLTNATLPKCNNMVFIDNVVEKEKNKPENPNDQITSTISVKSSINPNLHVNYIAELTLPSITDTIWVVKEGSNKADCGTRNSPCNTIGQGVKRCTNNCAVLISAEEYTLSNTIQLKEGVSLIGGFHNFKHSKEYQTYINGPSNGDNLFEGNGLGKEINIENFILTGEKRTQSNPQVSSIIKLSNCSQVNFNYLNIEPPPSQKGLDGTNGTKGNNGNPGNWGSNGSGGQGGKSPCGNNTGQGGTGGNQSIGNITTEWSGLTCEWKCSAKINQGGSGSPGSTGYSAPGAQGAYFVCYGFPTVRQHPKPPSQGENGRNATCGKGGLPNPNLKGFFVNGSWKYNTGGNGASGAVGGGGGGGGSGAFCGYAKFGCSGRVAPGTAAGGGGGGGCGGSQSSGGQMGAPSFGVILINSSINVVDNQVVIVATIAGNGGKGGDGAPGGYGASGGQAQPTNNICKDLGGEGSKGGTGGKGGASAGSAGGNGGPSACVALVGNSKIIGNPIFYLGLGGKGGKGGAAGPQGDGACSAPGGKIGNNNLSIDIIKYK